MAKDQNESVPDWLILNAAGALIGAAIGASALKAKVGGGDE